MYSTWTYQCTKYRRNQIFSSVRPIFDPYWHQLLTVNLQKRLIFTVSLQKKFQGILNLTISADPHGILAPE